MEHTDRQTDRHQADVFHLRRGKVLTDGHATAACVYIEKQHAMVGLIGVAAAVGRPSTCIEASMYF